MKFSKKNGNSLITVILLIVIIVLVGGVVFLALKYEALDEKYDRLEDKYENKDYSISNENKSNVAKESDVSEVTSSKYISRDKALDIVLKDLNITENDIYDLDIELENKMKYENTIFEISFDYGRYEYEYYVDAVTGEILDSFQSKD